MIPGDWESDRTPSLESAAVLLGVRHDPDQGRSLSQAAGSALGCRLPAAVREFFAYPDLMAAIAAVYDGRAAAPVEVLLNDGHLPGVDEPVLMLMFENQGVCSWGVPLERGENPPVLVGGDLTSGVVTVEHAASLPAFAAAYAFDAFCHQRSPMLMAQAAELDQETRSQLATRYRVVVETLGWPGLQQLRFVEDLSGVTIVLWSDQGQCDWWITAPSIESLEREVRNLMGFSNLESALWSNDRDGIAVLQRVKASR